MNELIEKGIKLDNFFDDIKEEYLESARNIKAYIDKKEIEPMVINEELDILIVGEDWCVDCIVNLTILKKLLFNNKMVNYGIVDLETYKEFYNISERVYIPLIIFYNSDGKEIGRWIETPEKMKDIRNNKSKDFILKEMEEYKKGSYVEHTIEEIKEIVKPIS